MKFQFQTILLILFSILYLSPRLLPLSQKLEFRSDQGVHLLETKTMVDDRKIPLIGPVTSKAYEGRQFFTGATYYYLLTLFGLVTNWSPIGITSLIIVLEFLFYLIFFRYIQKEFGYISTTFIALTIALAPYLVFHSYFFWNPHFLIPLSILFLIFRKNPYLSAVVFGFAISFHYSAVFWFLPYILFRIKYQQLRLKIIVKSIPLFLIANLPFLLFEFRNQFYNFKTMYLVFNSASDTLSLTPHYFVFPLLILLVYFILYLSKKYHYPIYLIFIFVLFLKDSAALLYQNGWNYQSQQRVVDFIKNNCSKNFNIASTLTGDTRAYDLRFLLAISTCRPEAVNMYPSSSTIFFVSTPSRPPETETVWEINSFKPFKVTNKEIINNNVILYRLDKTSTNP